MKKVLEASHAVAEAVKLAVPDVIAAYPITPQTHIVEELSQMVADGDLTSDYLRVESEFAAISAVLGASAAGSRAYTATASQGLALMYEVLFIVSGMRLPVVMNVANRALSAPISIWNDHQDSMSARDIGWLQFHAETAQECLDLTLMAFKVSEHKDVLLPSMVCLDGFTLSHVYEPCEIPAKSEVDSFLPKYQPVHAKIDIDKPITQGPIGFPTHYMELRHAQQDATIASATVIKNVFKEFGEKFGRTYDFFELYKADDADILILGMGSECGTVKVVVDEMREQGHKVGLLKMTVFRPFPTELLREYVKNCKVLAVLDKSFSAGNEGIAFSEVKAALYSADKRPEVRSFIVGLGGRDIKYEHIKDLIDMCENGKGKETEWLE